MALINAIDVDEAAVVLRRWWSARHPDNGDVRIADVHIPKSSGMSSETILFRVSQDSSPTSTDLVARLIVPGRNLYPSYDFEVERQAMNAAGNSAGVPVPQVETIEWDASFLGAPFLVMGRVHGQVMADDPPYSASGWLLDLDAPEQAVLYDNALTTLAKIATADTSAMPSQTLGHPARGASAMVQHLDYWEQFYAWAAGDRQHGLVEHGLKWLRNCLPSDERPAVLSWGDARLGNCMFGPDRKVSAVLDWEMTALGPPELDLAWFLVTNRIYTEGFGLPSPSGFPDRNTTIARYSEVARREIRDLHYAEVFAALRCSLLILRLGNMMIEAGLIPADDPLPTNNPPSSVLQSLLGIEQSPDGEQSWFAGRR